MALVLRLCIDAVSDLMNKHRDPRVQHFPMLQSPIPVLLILSSYLYFVKVAGPAWMANKKPFNLQRVINVYNILQILINLYVGIFGFYYSYWQPDFSLKCQPVDRVTTPERLALLKVCYVYLLSRIFDLLDTIFFVLRKKNSHITFLAVYHHVGIVCGAWVFNVFISGSHPALLGVVNSFVHVFMYGYYFCTNFRPELKKSIWWKKYITQIQIIQFVILIIHFGLPILYKDCTHPKMLLLCGFLQNLFMLILFSDFYYKAYVRKRPKPA